MIKNSREKKVQRDIEENKALFEDMRLERTISRFIFLLIIIFY